MGAVVGVVVAWLRKSSKSGAERIGEVSVRRTEVEWIRNMHNIPSSVRPSSGVLCVRAIAAGGGGDGTCGVWRSVGGRVRGMRPSRLHPDLPKKTHIWSTYGPHIPTEVMSSVIDSGEGVRGPESRRGSSSSSSRRLWVACLRERGGDGLVKCGR